MNELIYTGSALLLLLLFSGTSWADMDCTNPSESQQVLECANAKAKISETKLNEAYTALVKSIESSCPEGSRYCSETKKQLIASERLWIQLRQADCALETQQIEAGTAAFETARSLCLSDKAEQRTSYLKHLNGQL
ncbi:lysozyme inhibitor LprI family protein [Pseudomonas oryzihabitans]|uniref:lysozyme inhibitor LprI family protein n=1 Tax=Pseudomonas oryzihabitans TaxID=47885 RepID=UPI00285C24E3|nr:lysozyme inhibitor LprI family protein [Pseudomonas psychrotolerans]MDR6677900.1 uncharacterized protein YecT (DUF1311 family) [Pseudomonas psychrotolerans]